VKRARAAHGSVGAREEVFWDEHVPDLEHCLRELEAGPDPNTTAMFGAIAPLEGLRVLDFACGPGVTAAFLAKRGAIVTGIDISPVSIARGRELAQHTGLSIDFVVGELTPDSFSPATFDAVVGRYALHHVDLAQVAPILGGILVPGGRCAFVETMALNPLLNFARRRIAGYARVANLGSDDEHPLRRADLHILETNLGQVRLLVGEMRFLRIFDRNVLRYGHPRVSAFLAGIDDVLLRCGLGVLSYHQVVALTKRS
jgi:SAM-dependent methyltransferase